MCAAQKVKAGDASLCKQLHNNGGLCGMLCTLLPTTLALLHAALVLGTLTKGEGGGGGGGSEEVIPSLRRALSVSASGARLSTDNNHHNHQLSIPQDFSSLCQLAQVHTFSDPLISLIVLTPLPLTSLPLSLTLSLQPPSCQHARILARPRTHAHTCTCTCRVW